jgi:hypothetical protein
VDVDGGRSGVVGVALGGLFDAVVVVAGAFDCTWAAPVSSGRVGLSGDLGQDVGQGVVPVLREKPAVPVAVRRVMRRARVKEILSGSGSGSGSAAWAAG